MGGSQQPGDCVAAAGRGGDEDMAEQQAEQQSRRTQVSAGPTAMHFDVADVFEWFEWWSHGERLLTELPVRDCFLRLSCCCCSLPVAVPCC
jgi:hypothetical protein